MYHEVKSNIFYNLINDTQNKNKVQVLLSIFVTDFFWSKVDSIDFEKNFDKEMCIVLKIIKSIKKDVHCEFCNEICKYKINRTVAENRHRKDTWC